MTDILIFAESNSRQTGAVIYDKTDWNTTGGSIANFTQVRIEVFQSSLIEPISGYELTTIELDSFIDSGQIELDFSKLVGQPYLADGWWTVRLSANNSDFVSNFSGFGIYANITHAVFNRINSLHVPEEIKYNAEKYAIMAIFLEGLKYLDNTYVNSRGVKFAKRLNSLQKMISNI